jgi:hypothetical protein
MHSLFSYLEYSRVTVKVVLSGKFSSFPPRKALLKEVLAAVNVCINKVMTINCCVTSE